MSFSPAAWKAKNLKTPEQKAKMSITRTFYLAHQARAKLSSEAAKSDHNLRLLVGHANLLDRLMLNLQHAEKEQDAWFNAAVRGNSLDDDEEEEDNRMVMETLQEEDEEEEEVIGSLAQDYPESESSDEESEEEEEEIDYEWSSSHIVGVAIPRRPVYDYSKTVIDVDEVEVEDEEDDEDGFYALTRTHSHHPMPSPPELIEDDDSESESNPPSPPQPTLAAPLFFEPKNQKQTDSSVSFFESSSAEFESTAYYSSSSMIPAF